MIDRRRALAAALAALVPVSAARAAPPQGDAARTVVSRQIERFYEAFNAGDWAGLSALLTPTPTILWRGGRAGGSPEAVATMLRAVHDNGFRYRIAPAPSQAWLPSDRGIKTPDPDPLWFPNDHTAVAMVQRSDSGCNAGDRCWQSGSPYDEIHIFTFLYSGNGPDAERQLFSRINLATVEG